MVYYFLAWNEGEILYAAVQQYIDEISQNKVVYIINLSHLGKEGQLKIYY